MVPPAALPQQLMVVMQNAPISHEHTSAGIDDYLTEGRYTVLERHDAYLGK
jgi:hypothetical protein